MARVRSSEDGFTLIELLVVVGIIGILAAVALPAFLGQTRGASDAKAKADVNNAQKALEGYWTEHDTYGATVAELIATEGALGKAINLTVSGDDVSYRITADSKRGSTFVLEKNASTETRTCTPIGIGGCDSAGTW